MNYSRFEMTVFSLASPEAKTWDSFTMALLFSYRRLVQNLHHIPSNMVLVVLGQGESYSQPFILAMWPGTYLNFTHPFSSLSLHWSESLLF